MKKKIYIFVNSCNYFIFNSKFWKIWIKKNFFLIWDKRLANKKKRNIKEKKGENQNHRHNGENKGGWLRIKMKKKKKNSYIFKYICF